MSEFSDRLHAQEREFERRAWDRLAEAHAKFDVDRWIVEASCDRERKQDRRRLWRWAIGSLAGSATVLGLIFFIQWILEGGLR